MTLYAYKCRFCGRTWEEYRTPDDRVAPCTCGMDTRPTVHVPHLSTGRKTEGK